MLTEAQIAKGQKNIDRIRSKENFHPALGKTARNESRKIRATYYNNVSIGLALAGALVPAITVLPKLIRSIVANFHDGNYFGEIPPEVLIPILLGVIAMSLSNIWHIRAINALTTIED